MVVQIDFCTFAARKRQKYMITQKLKMCSLAVGCMFLATLGVAAQTYDETYHKQDIVLAAQKNGEEAEKK